jgi:hypothetical protein
MLDKKTLTRATRTLPTGPSFNGEHEARMLNLDHHLAKRLRLPRPLDPLHEVRRLNVDHHLEHRLRLPRLLDPLHEASSRPLDPLDPLHEARRLNVDHHLEHRLRHPRPSDRLHKARASNVDHHLAHRLHLQTHRCRKTQTMTNWRGLPLRLLVAYRLSFWLVNARLLTLPTVIANLSIHLNKRSSNTTKLSKRPPPRTLHPLQLVDISGPAKSHFACQQGQNRPSSPHHRSSLSYWGFLCVCVSGPTSQVSRFLDLFCCIRFLACCYDSLAASISRVSESTSLCHAFVGQFKHVFIVVY